MTRQQMTEPEAFRWIQRTAMDRRTTMKAVAEAVVDGLGHARAYSRPTARLRSVRRFGHVDHLRVAVR